MNNKSPWANAGLWPIALRSPVIEHGLALSAREFWRAKTDDPTNDKLPTKPTAKHLAAVAAAQTPDHDERREAMQETDICGATPHTGRGGFEPLDFDNASADDVPAESNAEDEEDRAPGVAFRERVHQPVTDHPDVGVTTIKNNTEPGALASDKTYEVKRIVSPVFREADGAPCAQCGAPRPFGPAPAAGFGDYRNNFCSTVCSNMYSNGTPRSFNAPKKSAAYSTWADNAAALAPVVEPPEPHADHGRGTAEEGPEHPDCPCRGTAQAPACAASGCGFCSTKTGEQLDANLDADAQGADDRAHREGLRAPGAPPPTAPQSIYDRWADSDESALVSTKPTATTFEPERPAETRRMVGGPIYGAPPPPGGWPPGNPSRTHVVGGMIMMGPAPTSAPASDAGRLRHVLHSEKDHKGSDPDDVNDDVERCNICSGGLALCTVCHQGEAELEEWCPGPKVVAPVPDVERRADGVIATQPWAAFRGATAEPISPEREAEIDAEIENDK